jgi:prevent-host-death family protein
MENKIIEINVKQARSKISSILNKVEQGEEMVIVRRGKKVARMVPFNDRKTKRLPDLSKFRASINIPRKGLSETILEARNDERF